MPENRQTSNSSRASKIQWNKFSSAASLTLIFLIIELFDELHYGINGAALPSVKASLGLNLNQLGMLLGLPAFVNTIIEPVLMILGDTNRRRYLIAMAIDSLSGLAGGSITWMVGAIAITTGVRIAMWLLVAGPVCLLIGIPRSQMTIHGESSENEIHDGWRSE